ncbi:MAG: hypothetical protein PHI37_00090 [Candidatus Gracilibacteria bacterium]|nr:hypothetical protein [Candidatus Gracilibacteria bacterium]
MKKTKTILYFMILSTFFKVGNVFSDFGTGNINPGLMGNFNNADIVIQDYTQYLLGFLYLLAVLYGIYGGFKILTAAEDDEKVKSGKTIIIQAILGIIIIFLAGPIVDLFLGNGGNDVSIIGE